MTPPAPVRMTALSRQFGAKTTDFCGDLSDYCSFIMMHTPNISKTGDTFQHETVERHVSKIFISPDADGLAVFLLMLKGNSYCFYTLHYRNHYFKHRSRCKAYGLVRHSAVLYQDYTRKKKFVATSRVVLERAEMWCCELFLAIQFARNNASVE